MAYFDQLPRGIREKALIPNANQVKPHREAERGAYSPAACGGSKATHDRSPAARGGLRRLRRIAAARRIWYNRI